MFFRCEYFRLIRGWLLHVHKQNQSYSSVLIELIFWQVFTSRAAARSYAALDYSCSCSRSDFCFFQHWNIFYWYFVIWMVIIFQFFENCKFSKNQIFKKFKFSKKKFKFSKKFKLSKNSNFQKIQIFKKFKFLKIQI